MKTTTTNKKKTYCEWQWHRSSSKPRWGRTWCFRSGSCRRPADQHTRVPWPPRTRWCRARQRDALAWTLRARRRTHPALQTAQQCNVHIHPSAIPLTQTPKRSPDQKRKASFFPKIILETFFFLFHTVLFLRRNDEEHVDTRIATQWTNRHVNIWKEREERKKVKKLNYYY